jgi:hypothetical protein
MLSKESIQEFKDIFEKETGKEISWEEATESAHNLLGLAEILYKQGMKEIKRKEKLKDNPKGFHIEGEGYTCCICRRSISNKETWYDKYGIKCLICQKAIDKKVIPGYVAKNEDSWYSTFELDYYFNIKYQTVNKLVRDGILKPRIITNENGNLHAYVFIIKENKDVLPPKKLVDSRVVTEVKDGKEWHSTEHWYKFQDPHKLLKDYKILGYLRVIIQKDKK